MSLEGVTGAPYKHPKIQKKIPAPYSRPSISVGEAKRAKRGWKQTPVTELVKDDIVADFGRVETVEEFVVRDPYAWNVKLTNAFGATKTFPGHDTVLAFSRE